MKTLVKQGTESSDLSLISDFFPTSRAILEISINLKRNYFRKWGYAYWGKTTKKKNHWNAPFVALKSKKFLGEDPHTPLLETIPFRVPLIIRMHPPSSFTLRTFQTFLPKPILAPVKGWWKNVGPKGVKRQGCHGHGKVMEFLEF